MQDTLGDISHHENGWGLRARQWTTEANLHINTIQELLPSFASVLKSSWLHGGHNGPWMLEVKCWLYVDSRQMRHHLYSTTGTFDMSGSMVSGLTGEGALILHPRGLSQHHFSDLTSQGSFSATTPIISRGSSLITAEHIKEPITVGLPVSLDPLGWRDAVIFRVFMLEVDFQLHKCACVLRCV